MTRKLLFVCSGGIQRSPTFATRVKERFPEVETKSCGIFYGYPEQLNEPLCEWADEIYLMDLSHKKFMEKHYGDYLYKAQVIGISDQYDRDDIQLIELVDYWLRGKKWQ